MESLLVIGLALIILGIFFVFLSSIQVAPGTKSEVKTGGVVIIGPFPVIFGSDKDAVLFAGIAAIIIILALLLFFMAH